MVVKYVHYPAIFTPNVTNLSHYLVRQIVKQVLLNVNHILIQLSLLLTNKEL